MPTRTPIIPGPAGSRRLLRALHTEMKEKKLIQEQQVAPYPDSGVHSNSSSDTSEHPNVSDGLRKKPKTRRQTNMPNAAVEGEHADSSTCTDSDESDEDVESRGDEHTSSDDDATHGGFHSYRGMWNGQQQKKDTRAGDFKKIVGKSREAKPHDGAQHHLRKRNDDVSSHKRRTEEIVLSEKDKHEIREGYQKFVLNGEPMSGTSFSSRPSAFTRVQKLPEAAGDSDSSDELQFPFEEAATGGAEPMSVREAKRLEKESKQKTKARKGGVAEAKLFVSEAKLSEFAAKLAARQARIDERHAKMCRRRAVMKSAEERLQALEARLDAEEEEHRDRERRVKNRERRVRQEEAGLQIKESSLKKREVGVTESIKDIERRRKLVEEKEEMLGAMEDIMKKREVLHRGEEKSRVGKAVGSLGKKILRSNKQQSNHVTEAPSHSEERHEHATTASAAAREAPKLERTQKQRSSTGSYKQSAPIPTPRKSIEKRSPEKRGRSTSLNSDGEEAEKSPRKPVLATGSLPRYRGQKAVMGLWL